MAKTKNEIAATMSRQEAAQAGVLTFTSREEVELTVAKNTRTNFGFTRKQLPKGLPQEPRSYIYSISEYGEQVNLGPGFQLFTVPACPEGEQHGEPCVINALHFFEEAKVDVTEHTFNSGAEICNAIMKIGPGMNASWDRRKLGWFVSPNYPPTQEEIDAAVTTYTIECQRLLNEGNRHASNNQLREINETHRRAAKYLKQKVDWEKSVSKMVDCPGCGEPVKDGAAKHAVPYCGYIFDWPRAIEKGMAKLEDAPADIREELLTNPTNK